MRVVVPFPAGSSTDIITRVLTNSVSQAIGQQLVVDNKAGADGAIAAAEVAKAAPDGYTLLMATNSPMSAVPALKKSPPYDPVADFTPITDIGRYTFFILVHPSVPAKTLAELIDYARANPGKLNYATGNTTGIVSTRVLRLARRHPAGARAVQGRAAGGHRSRRRARAAHVLLVGHFDRAHPRRPAARAGHHARQTQPHAAGSADHRGSRHAAVLDHLVGRACSARRACRARWCERLNKEFGAAMARPDVQAAMEKQAFALSPSSPEQLAAFVKEQMESYRRILRAAGVEPE